MYRNKILNMKRKWQKENSSLTFHVRKVLADETDKWQACQKQPRYKWLVVSLLYMAFWILILRTSKLEQTYKWRKRFTDGDEPEFSGNALTLLLKKEAKTKIKARYISTEYPHIFYHVWEVSNTDNFWKLGAWFNRLFSDQIWQSWGAGIFQFNYRRSRT